MNENDKDLDDINNDSKNYFKCIIITWRHVVYIKITTNHIKRDYFIFLIEAFFFKFSYPNSYLF